MSGLWVVTLYEGDFSDVSDDLSLPVGEIVGPFLYEPDALCWALLYSGPREYDIVQLKPQESYS